MTSASQQTHIFVGHEMIRHAEARLRPFVRETGVERAPLLESGEGCVWLKLELQQVTGSFKVRGALNALSALSEAGQEPPAGIVACSAGNHALGVAFAAQVCGFPVQLFVPESIDVARKRALEHYPAELVLVRGGYGDAERAAQAAAEASQRLFLSPYDDPLVVAGQGTVAAELMRQIPDLDAVFVAVGGGGLLAGIGSYVRAINPGIEIVAVSPARSPAMCDRLAGRTAPALGNVQTISDSTAGDIDPASITVDLCRALVSRWVLLTEEEIATAMRYLFFEHRLVAEGAGALAVAAYTKERSRYQDKNCALIVCGGNIEAERFLKLVQPP